jgi:quercetin dioxygenase-like cupin family protein
MKFATARATAIAVAGLGLTAALCLAQAQGFRRTPVQSGDLSVGRQAVQAVAEIDPKAQSGRHTHPGEEIGYVLDGTIILEIEGMPPKTLKAGEGFIVPNGKVHNARNTGTSVAKVLGTYIVEKGKPVATPVQ